MVYTAAADNDVTKERKVADGRNSILYTLRILSAWANS